MYELVSTVLTILLVAIDLYSEAIHSHLLSYGRGMANKVLVPVELLNRHQHDNKKTFFEGTLDIHVHVCDCCIKLI